MDQRVPAAHLCLFSLLHLLRELLRRKAEHSWTDSILLLGDQGGRQLLHRACVAIGTRHVRKVANAPLDAEAPLVDPLGPFCQSQAALIRLSLHPILTTCEESEACEIHLGDLAVGSYKGYTKS